MLQNVTAKFTLFYGNQIQNKGEERIVGHIDNNKYNLRRWIYEIIYLAK